ncbi:MAG: histidinol-phosphate aminotransferase [Saprospiraceae bacterium]|jgi:histidinol-phosphate aminotransferase
MKNISRRNWLKVSGLTGASTLIGSSKLAGHTLTELGRPKVLSEEIIRLSSNENPYGPSPKVRAAMSSSFDDVCRYPGMFYKELVVMLAEKHNVSADHIILTAGSTEGLKMAGLTFGGDGSNIVAADPVFLALQNYSEQFGTYIHKVPVTKDMTHDLEAMEMRITQSTRLVYVCNPNNPTSALEPAEKLESFCKAISKRTTVFADEAYFDYIQDPNYPSMIDLVRKGMNVIVARTFSKVYGLAGIRIGYLIARPDIVKRLGKTTMAGPNVLAVAAAKEALKDKEFYKFSIEQNLVMRTMVTDQLDQLGLPYVPSAGNFVFFKTGRAIEDVNKSYLYEGIRVGRAFPPLTDWCRVSMGTMEQVEKLCMATNKIFA